MKKDLGNDREQGIYYQSLVDIMADALIEKSENKPRIMTFHNFYDHYSDKIQRKQFDTLGQSFIEFPSIQNICSIAYIHTPDVYL